MSIMVPTTKIRVHRGATASRFEQMFVECQPGDPAVRRPVSPIPDGRREWRGFPVVDEPLWDGMEASVYPAFADEYE